MKRQNKNGYTTQKGQKDVSKSKKFRLPRKEKKRLKTSRKESFQVSIGNTNKIYWKSSEGIRYFNNKALYDVVKVQLSKINTIENLYLIKTYKSGLVINTLLTKVKQKKQIHFKNKGLKCKSNHINYGKGNERLICIQCIDDPSNVQRVEKWIYNEYLSKEWKIIPKEEYKRLRGKKIYIIGYDRDDSKVDPMPAYSKSPWDKYIKDADNIEDKNTVSLLIKILKPEPSIEEIKRKAINKAYKIKNKRILVKKHNSTTKSILKRRRLATNRSHFDVVQKYTKYSYIDRLKYQKKDELLAIEETRQKEQKKYRELRNKRYVERQLAKETLKTIPINKNEEIRKRFEEKELKLWKYRSLRAVKQLKSKHNGTGTNT